MLIRLQKIIASSGITSRRKAEEMIQKGLVTINGRVVTGMGIKADPDKDHIKVGGRLIHRDTGMKYVIFHKPKGVVTTLSDPEGRSSVIDYMAGIKGRLFPVGRLDFDSEGLLLLTNDGMVADKMMHPRNRVPRVYQVKVKGVLSDNDLSRLQSGVRLRNGKKASCQIGKFRKTTINSWVEMILFEGQKRQIRLMITAVGASVLRLKRTKFGVLELGTLAIGDYRHLGPSEVRNLREYLGLGSGVDQRKVVARGK